MRISDLSPPRDLPAPDAVIPAVALRAAFGVCGLALSLTSGAGVVWIVLGGLLAIGAALAPESLLAWALIAVLGIGQLSHHASLGVHPLVLLAGVHLLHALGLLCRELPWRSWIQPAVFLGPALRYLAIQIPCQIVAIAALALFAPDHGTPPGHVAAFAAIGALGLAGLAFILLREPAEAR